MFLVPFFPTELSQNSFLFLIMTETLGGCLSSSLPWAFYFSVPYSHFCLVCRGHQEGSRYLYWTLHRWRPMWYHYGWVLTGRVGDVSPRSNFEVGFYKWLIFVPGGKTRGKSLKGKEALEERALVLWRGTFPRNWGQCSTASPLQAL